VSDARIRDVVLETRGLTCGYDGGVVLEGINLRLARGEFVGLIGPNGSGKTTLLRGLTGVLRPLEGDVVLEGRSLRSYPRREVARRLAVVPQMAPAPFEFTVREIVQMGRTPHLGRLQGERAVDREAVRRALELTETAAFADRPATELSGGELQRVVIARGLAQESPIMLLDEPVAFLDINHQAQIFDLLARLNAEEGRSILCVSHDLNLASEYCQRLVLLSGGRHITDGPPEQVLTEERIQGVYGCRVVVDQGPGGHPRVTLLSERTQGHDAGTEADP